MKCAIVIPTYNERENIVSLIQAIEALNLDAHIIVVDDNSPDGTGEIVEKLAREQSNIAVLHRSKKEGLGRAYVDGFRRALVFGVDGVVTMDADFSHDPNDIKRLLNHSHEYEIVVGSRYIKGGRSERWEFWRKLLSLGGIFITRLLLGLKVRDCTAGFKFYSRRYLESLNLDDVSSGGYAFQVEMIFNAELKKLPIKEIPIVFRGREQGESKVSLREIFRFGRDLLRLMGRRLSASSSKSEFHSADFQKLNKDYYRHIENYDWVNVTDNMRGLETFFHRSRVRAVKKLIDQYGYGDKYLDAGCGTGLILRHLPVGSIGLDINPRNLEKAKRYAPVARLILGDIENIPFDDNFFSTVVCTEVLEHQPDPNRSLLEIKRVLRAQGLFIGSVPRRSFIWRLRFLSRTCDRAEPFHKEYRLKEMRDLLSRYFEIIKLSRATFGMNLIFACRNSLKSS